MGICKKKLIISPSQDLKSKEGECFTKDLRKMLEIIAFFVIIGGLVITCLVIVGAKRSDISK